MTFQASDTLIAQAHRDAVAIAADWALVLAASTVAVCSIIAVVILIRTLRAAQQVGRETTRRAEPLLERSKSVAANVEFITASLRTDIEGLNRSIRALNDRLAQASDHMERRIDDFNALMEVVQGEAEDIFLDTAATTRGVRAGMRTLATGDRRRVDELPPPPPPPAPDPTSE